LLLRNRLLSVRDSKFNLKSIELTAIVIKAWNHFSSGRSIKNLRWLSSEAFPVIN
jgi:hypothetical protein